MDPKDASNLGSASGVSSSSSSSSSASHASVGLTLDPSSSTAKGGLRKDLSSMMFGFGDSWPPDERSVALMEVLVENYISDLTLRASIVATSTGKLDKECFQYIVRKDRNKFNRIFRLLKSKEEIEKETEKKLEDELAP